MTAGRSSPIALAVAALAATAALAAGGAGASPTGKAAAPWWITAIRADRAAAPGPGRPVAFVDTGIDMGLPLFARRANTVPLNGQRLRNRYQYHGSAVASLVVGTGADASPVVGVYPRARLVVWNAAESGELTLRQIVAGIDAVSARGPSVINLSVGGGFYSSELEQAVLRAIARGSFVVAAVGNERPLVTFLARPAGEPHVFTVSSVGKSLGVSRFSSQSSGIDVAAPGEELAVAVPLAFDETGESLQSGTSFSAAIASGAAAWVWTRRPDLDTTQLFEVLRRSARHVGRSGVNLDTGWGVLDVAAALRFPAPPKDPQEPNDDIDQVAPGPIVRAGRPLLVGPGRAAAAISARIDGTKDPHDVYRVVIPAHSALTLRTDAPRSVRLRVWDGATRSVDGITTDQPRHLLATVRHDGGHVDLRYANPTGRPLPAYVDVWMIDGELAGRYTLSATLARS